MKSKILFFAFILSGAPLTVFAEEPISNSSANVRVLGVQLPSSTLTEVDNLSAVSSVEMTEGLGFNLDPTNPWELTMAKRAGAIEGRFQESWSEFQYAPGPPKLSAQKEAAFDAMLNNFKAAGLEPLIVAGYGPPTTLLGTIALAQNAKMGDTVLNFTSKANSVLSQIVVTPSPRGLIQGSDGGRLVDAHLWSYAGAIIVGVDLIHNTITLASPLVAPLAAGYKLNINHSLHAPAGNSVDDPSVQAYINYVMYLANKVSAHGLIGRIEIWNEPRWAHDSWDGGVGCYYSPLPKGVPACHSPNFAFAKALFNITPPAGVHFNWAGTHKSGFNTLLGGTTGRIGMIPTQAQFTHSVSSESFHPYAQNPEDHAWDPACLASSSTRNIYTECTLSGENTGSNFKSEAQLSVQHLEKDGWTIETNVTEIGLETANQNAKADFLLRAYLTYHSLGSSRVNFYRLTQGAPNAVSLGVIPAPTKVNPMPTPYIGYTAMQGFIKDVSNLSIAPSLPMPAANLPEIAAYHGEWPLMSVPVIGRKTVTDPGNSVYLVIWQRTYLTGSTTSFENITSPAAAPVLISIPANLHFVSALTLLDRSEVNASLTPTQFNQPEQVTLEVSDKPILLKFEAQPAGRKPPIYFPIPRPIRSPLQFFRSE